MNAFGAMFKKELREQVRTYKVMIGIAAFLVLGLTGPVTIKLLPEIIKSSNTRGMTLTVPPQTAFDAAAAYVSGFSSLPVIVVILLAMGAVAEERLRGTAALILTKPVSRTVFILAKFLALSLTLILSLLITAAAAWGYIAGLFEPIDLPTFLYVNLGIYLTLEVVLAATLLASTLIRSNVGAAGAAFLFFLALSLLPNIAAPLHDNAPTTIFLTGANILSGTANLSAMTGILISALALTFLLLGSTIGLFRRQEVV